jgi:hypothetical protein
MGTVTDQPPRSLLPVSNRDVELFIDDAIRLSKQKSISLSDVLTAFHIKELERQNTLSVHNGNIYDEQMMGLGELLEKTNKQLASLTWAISNSELEGGALADALFAVADAIQSSSQTAS